MLTEHIVDVREGQQSSGFRKYYSSTEMKDRAFSIFVEEERLGKVDKHYAYSGTLLSNLFKYISIKNVCNTTVFTQLSTPSLIVTTLDPILKLRASILFSSIKWWSVSNSS